jgi:outer membrane receptor protein involved in Fe transport
VVNASGITEVGRVASLTLYNFNLNIGEFNWAGDDSAKVMFAVYVGNLFDKTYYDVAPQTGLLFLQPPRNYEVKTTITF